jgi:DNA-binding MarR family transcriptional regulator
MREVARHLRELIVATDDYRRTMAASIDVSTGEAAVLGQLLHEGALTPTLIGARTGLTPASATALIDRLVSAGLVERTPHPDDRRRVLVELTAAGRSAIETMYSMFATDLEDALCRADPDLADDPERRASLTELLRAMAASLRTQADDTARARTTIHAAASAQHPARARSRGFAREVD